MPSSIPVELEFKLSWSSSSSYPVVADGIHSMLVCNQKVAVIWIAHCFVTLGHHNHNLNAILYGRKRNSNSHNNATIIPHEKVLHSVMESPIPPPNVCIIVRENWFKISKNVWCCCNFGFKILLYKFRNAHCGWMYHESLQEGNKAVFYLNESKQVRSFHSIYHVLLPKQKGSS